MEKMVWSVSGMEQHNFFKDFFLGFLSIRVMQFLKIYIKNCQKIAKFRYVIFNLKLKTYFLKTAPSLAKLSHQKELSQDRKYATVTIFFASSCFISIVHFTTILAQCFKNRNRNNIFATIVNTLSNNSHSSLNLIWFLQQNSVELFKFLFFFYIRCAL